jgi:hypothetical protein
MGIRVLGAYREPATGVHARIRLGWPPGVRQLVKTLVTFR